MARKKSDNPFAAIDKRLFPKNRGKKTKSETPPQENVAPLTEEDMFFQAMRGVDPLRNSSGRDIPPETIPASPSAAQAEEEYAAQQALLDLIQGKIEFEITFTSEYIEGRVHGMNSRLMAQLKAGGISPEGHLDFHGLNAELAWHCLKDFLRESYFQGKRCVLIIPGRGLNSPLGYGILREKLQSWLTRDPFKRVVLAFCTARPQHGGAGALYVLLRKKKKDSGKILWDRTPSDEELL